MHFASMDGDDDDYGEMWKKVINGGWLFSPETSISIATATHERPSDQLLGNWNRSLRDLIVATLSVDDNFRFDLRKL